MPDRAHIMLGSKASWVRVPRGPGEKHFEGYPDQSIEDWHRSQGVYVE